MLANTPEGVDSSAGQHARRDRQQPYHTLLANMPEEVDISRKIGGQDSP